MPRFRSPKGSGRKSKAANALDVLNYVGNHCGKKIADLKSLNSGIELCAVLNSIKPKIIRKVFKKKMRYMMNISNVLNACQKIGVHPKDLCSPDDVTLGNEKAITFLIIGIDQAAKKIKDYKGPRLGDPYNPENWAKAPKATTQTETKTKVVGKVEDVKKEAEAKLLKEQEEQKRKAREEILAKERKEKEAEEEKKRKERERLRQEAREKEREEMKVREEQELKEAEEAAKATAKAEKERRRKLEEEAAALQKQKLEEEKQKEMERQAAQEAVKQKVEIERLEQMRQRAESQMKEKDEKKMQAELETIATEHKNIQKMLKRLENIGTEQKKARSAWQKKRGEIQSTLGLGAETLGKLFERSAYRQSLTLMCASEARLADEAEKRLTADEDTLKILDACASLESELEAEQRGMVLTQSGLRNGIEKLERDNEAKSSKDETDHFSRLNAELRKLEVQHNLNLTKLIDSARQQETKKEKLQLEITKIKSKAETELLQKRDVVLSKFSKDIANLRVNAEKFYAERRVVLERRAKSETIALKEKRELALKKLGEQTASWKASTKPDAPLKIKILEAETKVRKEFSEILTQAETESRDLESKIEIAERKMSAKKTELLLAIETACRSRLTELNQCLSTSQSLTSDECYNKKLEEVLSNAKLFSKNMNAGYDEKVSKLQEDIGKLEVTLNKSRKRTENAKAKLSDQKDTETSNESDIKVDVGVGLASPQSRMLTTEQNTVIVDAMERVQTDLQIQVRALKKREADLMAQVKDLKNELKASKEKVKTLEAKLESSNSSVPPPPGAIPAPPGIPALPGGIPPPSGEVLPPPGGIPAPPAMGGLPPPPAMGLPPPPTISSANSSRGNLLSAIRKGKSLKKGKKASGGKKKKSSSGGGGRGALLDAIKGGAKLKKASSRKLKPKKETKKADSGGGGAAGIMSIAALAATKFKQRKKNRTVGIDELLKSRKTKEKKSSTMNFKGTLKKSKKPRSSKPAMPTTNPVMNFRLKKTSGPAKKK